MSRVQGVNLQVGRRNQPLPVLSGLRRPSWYELTLMDVQEHVEAPRSTDRESRPPKKCPYFKALMCSIINSKTSNVQGATDQQG